MVFLVIIWALLICEAALQATLSGLAMYFPYVTGFLGSSIMYYLWSKTPKYFLLIPGHSILSYIVAIVIAEVIICVLLNIKTTKKAVLVLLCITFPAYLLNAFQISVDSWQMALICTVISLILFGCEFFIAIAKYIDWEEKSNRVIAIINSISDSFAIVVLVHSLSYCFWEPYMTNVGKLKSLETTRLIITILLIIPALILPHVNLWLQKNKI